MECWHDSASWLRAERLRFELRSKVKARSRVFVHGADQESELLGGKEK